MMKRWEVHIPEQTIVVNAPAKKWAEEISRTEPGLFKFDSVKEVR